MRGLLLVLVAQCMCLSAGVRTSGMKWSGCREHLVIEYSNDPNYVPGPERFMASSSFSLDNWESVDLFTKSLGGEPGCKKSYSGKCGKGSIVVTETCNGTEVETGQKERCLGGLFCPKAKFRRTTVKPGDKLTLRVPKSEGWCEVIMTDVGYVKYYISSGSGLFAPSAREVGAVAAMAAEIAEDGDECGPAAMRIHRDAGNAATTLQELATSAASRADKKEDAVSQALNSLLALHFYWRHEALGPTSSRRAYFQSLAQDIQLIKGFEAVPQPIRSRPNYTKGMEALAHYYSGLAQHPVQTGKKRALIFTCSFGGGHKSAAKAVSGYLQTAGFETEIMDTTYDTHFYDRGNQMSAKVFNEFVIKRQNYAFFNVVDSLQQWMGPLTKPCPSPACNTNRKQQFRTAVLDHRPDLVVTVYHMELMPVLEVAKELGNLPVLHVATDMDIKMKEIFTEAATPVYPKFLAGIPFNLQESYDTIQPIEKSSTFLSGYPVRGAFLKPFDEQRVAAEKAKFVPEGTRVMLIMTGGGGQDVQWPYKLADRGIGMPFHIVIIAGGNNALAPKLRKAMPGDKTFPDGRVVWHGDDDSVTVEVATDPANTRTDKPYYVFEDRLALLMDMADVMMSKPGGGSTAEIAYRGVPAIFDTSISLFHWEKFTVDVFEKAKRGISFERETDLRYAIPAAINLGRSRILAEDKPGEIIDTSARIVQAAETLLSTKCAGCNVFEDRSAKSPQDEHYAISLNVPT